MNPFRLRFSPILLVLALAALPGCRMLAPTAAAPLALDRLDPAVAQEGKDPGRRRLPFRMLIVGNSLTYVNDLPGVIEALSVAAGDDPPMQVASVAHGGFALEDHLAQGDAAQAIAQGGWDVVALQQGPSTLPDSRANLIEYTQRFAVLIRAAGAKPALYGVWPPQERAFAFDDGIESYRQAAEAVGGSLYPVARAWKLAWARNPSLPFYSGDNFHPSELGTYTAALVIYTIVSGKSPVGLPAALTVRGSPYHVDPAQALLIQQVIEAMTHVPRVPPQHLWLWPRHLPHPTP